ncbi:DUF342 domain-containing protein [Marinimicrobium alkaliphilum]|uniref:DUF342 domain-containing protein n=1 Tax=Marinimicrobium alkaliphilum TaxID=2202654 RepID=UPI00130058E6|nr:FapA family protein [Marinimicrobium alkaliphilum]
MSDDKSLDNPSPSDTPAQDARWQWRLPDDELALYLQLEPARGGGAVPSVETWLEELEARSIVPDCISMKALSKAAQAAEPVTLRVARARMPEPGEDSRFELLVDLDGDLRPREDDLGKVDMHELQDFVVVDEGTALMRRHPPTSGSPGHTVTGKLIEPEPGHTRNYDSGLEGTYFDDKDPELLCAAIKGHPVQVGQGVRVDPVLRVRKVDLSTGNIDFDGSVEIAGDIPSDYSVKATGDILVRGAIEKAQVSAGGSIRVLGGIMGEDKGHDKHKELVLRTRIEAGGDISAKFVNQTELVAGGTIEIREYVMQSHLNAGERVLVGQQGGRGSILGGRTCAGHSIAVNTLGSNADVATRVEVTGAWAAESDKPPAVEVKRSLHTNVSVTISGCSHSFRRDHGPCCLIRAGDEIVPQG